MQKWGYLNFKLKRKEKEMSKILNHCLMKTTYQKKIEKRRRFITYEGLKTFKDKEIWTSELEHFVYHEEKWKPKEMNFIGFIIFLRKCKLNKNGKVILTH